MISLLIILTLIIGLVASLGYTVYSFQRSNDLISLAQRNAAQMDGLAAAMRGALRAVEVDGVWRVAAPIGDEVNIGDEANARSVLPRSVVGTALSPWGSNYGWCPYSPVKGTGSVSIKSGKKPYGVQVINGYVVASPTAPGLGEYNQAVDGIVGYIVSSAPFKSTAADLPDCDSVIRAGNGVLTVNSSPGGSPPGSIVAVSGRGTVAENVAYSQSSNSAPVVVVSLNGGYAANPTDCPENNGTLECPISYESAFRDIIYSRVKRATVKLALIPDVYPSTIESQGSVFNLFGARDYPIIITSARDTERATIASTSIDPIAGGLISSRVDFAGAGLWVLPGISISLTDGTISRLRIDSGSAALNSVSLLPGPQFQNSIEMTTGHLKLSGDMIFGASQPLGNTIYAMGGDIVFQDARISKAGELAAPGTKAKPWLLVNGARLSAIGATTYENTAITLFGLAEAECDAATGVKTAECTAECPALLYPVNASCGLDIELGSADGSDQAALQSSKKSGEHGWTCTWAAGRAYKLENNGSIIDGQMNPIAVPIAPDGLSMTVLPIPKRTVRASCQVNMQ